MIHKVKPILKDRKKLLGAVILALVVLFIGIRFRIYFLFVVFAVITGIMTYTFDMMKAMIDPGLVSFFNIFFSYTLGYKYGLIIILVGLVIPEILSGEGIMDATTTGLIYSVTGLAAALFKGTDLIMLGIILSLMQVVFLAILRSRIGVPVFEIISEDGMECVLTIVYFISFASFLQPLFI